MKERWRVVDGFPDYEVSDRGRVRSYKNKRWRRRTIPVLLLPQNYKGYLAVSLHSNGGRIHREFVHRLVLEAFTGPCPKGQECRHWDGNRSHNDLKNLLWGTRLENNRDKIRHGTNVGSRGHARGALNGNAVELSDMVVSKIRLRRKKGESLSSLARCYCVGRGIITSILDGTYWTVREARA